MEKTTKKRKAKKGLRKRIGIIAIGGMSVVLTVCLSVGATLAWFAGSTWASKSLYMGGPVYVEMAGRGTSGDTDGEPDGDGNPTKAEWIGGDGNLDIQAAALRQTGTGSIPTGAALSDILLPGQKVEVYTQARVFSTIETTTVDDDAIINESSGANTTNTSNGSGTATYQNTQGRVTTTTTSVLRARFSLEVEFDPGMGFNNFTADNSTGSPVTERYMSGYPVQSSNYLGDGDYNTAWADALGETFTTTNSGTAGTTGGTITYDGRRDGVAQPTATTENPNPVLWTKDQTTNSELIAIRKGTKRSIYKWKYVSAAEYAKAAKATDAAPNEFGQQMGAPFAGTPIDAADAPTGYYGVWVSEVVDPTAQTKTYKLSESDAFYKARCNAYLNTYTEFYVNEYGNMVERTVKDSVTALEANLNSQFVKLVNDSSDAIHDGGDNASWLYVDPLIGNDTNTDEISTSVGGWWYLVADDGAAVGSKGNGDNKIIRAVDSIGTNAAKDAADDAANEVTETTVITRANAAKDKDVTDVDNNKYSRLDAKLYEIVPDLTVDDDIAISMNGNVPVYKIVSTAFPFVNGTFALPADALTNLFANAKITFKVSFQALQAFFPYTESIDKVDYTSALLGTEKALSIRNAIPIYNEAFDYQETAGGTISGL